MVTDVIAIALGVIGGAFFLAGTTGLLRFPDTLSRLHALTKADNLGLGFVILSVAIVAGSATVIAKLAIIWVLVLAGSTTAAQLIASIAVREAESKDGGDARV